MIAYLSGVTKAVHKNYLILVAGQVGYRIQVPPQLLVGAVPGQKLDLYIHTHVREDQLSLLGFTTLKELDFFELLLTVSGIGPKMALSIMSVGDLEVIKSGIIGGDPAVFTKVSGVGRKTAQRLIVELKEEVSDGAFDREDLKVLSQEHADVIDVLLALGYTRSEARKVLSELPKNLANSEEKVRMALRLLAKN